MDIYAGSSNESYNYPQLLVNSHNLETNTFTVSSGQNLAQYQVCGIVSASKEVVAHDPAATDGSQTPAAIVQYAVDATSGAKTAVFFTAGAFSVDALVFHASLTTDAAKINAFKYAGSNITVQKLA